MSVDQTDSSVFVSWFGSLGKSEGNPADKA